MARLPSYKLTEYAYDYEHCIGPSRRKGRAAALLRGEPLCAEEVYEKILRCARSLHGGRRAAAAAAGRCPADGAPADPRSRAAR